MTATSIDFRAIVDRATKRRAFGTATRWARLDLGMSMAELAAFAECSPFDIDEVEGGHCQAAGILRRVCAVLGIEADEIEESVP